MADWRTFGAHEGRIVEGDGSPGGFLELRFHGTVDDKDTVEIFALVTEVQARYGRALLLVNASEARWLTPEARRYVVEWLRAHPEDNGVAVMYGANATVRALGSLLNSAVRVLTRRPTQNHFVKTEEEARTLLNRLRDEQAE